VVAKICLRLLNETRAFHQVRVIKQALICLTLSLTCLPQSVTDIIPAEAAEGSPPSKERPPIKIGLIVSLTGVGSSSCQDMVKGFELFLNQIHYQMQGRKVELIVENDGSSPTTGVEKIRKLVQQDKVQMVAGIGLSNVALAVAPEAERLQVPLMLAIAGADDLTKRKQLTWLVRTGYCNSQPMQPFGEYAYKTLHYKKVDIISVDYTYGWEASAGFQKTFEGAGGKVLQKLWVPLGFQDFSVFIKQLRKDADAVCLVTVGGAAELLPVQYKECGPNLPLIGSGPSFDEIVLQKTKEATLGAVSPMFYSATINTEDNKRFIQSYAAKYGADPSLFSEGAYTAGLWIAKAVDDLKGNIEDKNKLLYALKHVQLKNAPRGPIKLDAYGNPIQNIYVRKVERVNGRLQNSVIFTYKNVSQFWKYNPLEYLNWPPFNRDYPPVKSGDEQ